MAGTSVRKGGATPALQVLSDKGIVHQIHSYDFDPGDLGIGEQAAAALGISSARLFKTLMVVIDQNRPAMALVPVHAEVNMKALAASLGGKRAAMATIAQAERTSGYVKGGISPFGQKQRHDAAVDRSIQDHETIFVNGGRRGLQIELASADLLMVLEATVADLARRR